MTQLFHVEAYLYMDCADTFYLKAEDRIPNSRIEEMLRSHLRNNEIGLLDCLGESTLDVAFYSREQLRDHKGKTQRFDAYMNITSLGSTDDEVLRVLREYTPHQIVDFCDLK